MLSAWWLSCCMIHRVTLAPESENNSLVAHAEAVQTHTLLHRYSDVFATFQARIIVD